MKSSLLISGGFWTGGYTSEYNLEAALPAFHLPLLADHCIKAFLPPSIIEGQTITDLKGRDPLDLIQHGGTLTDPPIDDELLYVAGDLFFASADTDEPEPEPMPQFFSIRVNTIFEGFTGAHHIRHRLKIERTGQLPDTVPVTAIGRIFPLHIKLFRLGLNFFHSKRLPAFFGFAPTVDQTLLVEADEQRAFLKITLEGLKSLNNLAPRAKELLAKLNRIMQDIFKFNLIEDYTIRLSSGAE